MDYMEKKYYDEMNIGDDVYFDGGMKILSTQAKIIKKDFPYLILDNGEIYHAGNLTKGKINKYGM